MIDYENEKWGKSVGKKINYAYCILRYSSHFWKKNDYITISSQTQNVTTRYDSNRLKTRNNLSTTCIHKTNKWGNPIRIVSCFHQHKNQFASEKCESDPKWKGKLMRHRVSWRQELTKEILWKEAKIWEKTKVMLMLF